MCRDIVNYVFGASPDSTILGSKVNTYRIPIPTQHFFRWGPFTILGTSAPTSKDRYVHGHTTQSSPRGEHWTTRLFLNCPKAYMRKHMGIGDKPYIWWYATTITKHEHVHIVSTTIREDCLHNKPFNDFKTERKRHRNTFEKQFALPVAWKHYQDRSYDIIGSRNSRRGH